MYQPLTPEQFSKARAAGFTPEQIIEMERKRKAQQGPAPSTPQPEAPKRNVLQRAGDFLKKQVSGQKADYGFGGSLVDETVGSRGLLGVAQMPGKVAGQFGLLKDQALTDEARGRLSDQTRQLAIALRSATDPNERARLQKLIDENSKALGMVSSASNDLASRVVTPREAAATTVRAGSTALTGSGSATKNLLLKGASKLPAASGASIAKVATVGRGIIPRAAEQAGINMGFNAAGNIENARPLNQGAGQAGLAGAALPVIGTAAAKGKQLLSKGSDSYASRVINSLIKPLQKDFSYGKNPGRGVAAEGITFSSLDEGVEKISERKSEVGRQIKQFVKGMTWRFDAEDALEPLANALEKAKKSPRTNSEVIKRLDDVVQDLLQVTEKNGEKVPGRTLNQISAEDLFQLKQDVAELTKFTGNASDDQMVNKALKETYGRIKEKLNKALPELQDANERYADLASAEVAARYRDKIEQRANLVSLGGKVSAIGGAMLTVIASGGSAIPAVMAGAGVYGMEKALGSPRVKTRMAKWLAKSSAAEKKALYEKVPALKNAIERVFGYSD